MLKNRYIFVILLIFCFLALWFLRPESRNQETMPKLSGESLKLSVDKNNAEDPVIEPSIRTTKANGVRRSGSQLDDVKSSDPSQIAQLVKKSFFTELEKEQLSILSEDESVVKSFLPKEQLESIQFDRELERKDFEKIDSLGVLVRFSSEKGLDLITDQLLEFIKSIRESRKKEARIVKSEIGNRVELLSHLYLRSKEKFLLLKEILKDDPSMNQEFVDYIFWRSSVKYQKG